jgi:hypothetical protein
MEQIQRNTSEVTLADQNVLGQAASESSNSNLELPQVNDGKQKGSLASQHNTNESEHGRLEKQTPHEKLPSIFSPQLKQDRILLLRSILKVEVLLVVIVLGILSLYWGGLASLVPNQKVLTVAIVDFDGQEVGNALTQFGTILLKCC